MMNCPRRDRSLTPVPPLMELLATPLNRQKTAAKRLVIQIGEGYGSSLREIHTKGAMP